MKTLRFISMVGFAVLWLAGAGCTHVQVDSDTVGQYKLGELQVWSDKDFTRVYDAAKAGMKDMKLFQTQDDRKVIEAELRGRDAADTMVVVKIKEVAKGRTSLKIRYGVVSPNLPAAQNLYKAIEKHL